MDSLLELPAAIIVFALGAAIGSFLNVVIYRIPAKLSILWPPSRCPQCLHQLGKTENVPILGWLWLKGKCRHCRTKISVRYPLVEAASGLMFLIVFLIFGISIKTIGYWAFFSWLFALSMIDLDTMTLPNVLTRSGLVVGLIFQIWVGISTTDRVVGLANQLQVGIFGAVLGLWLLDIIRWLGTIVFKQEAMGDADPELAAMIGAWLGWQYVLLTLFLACGLGAFIGGGAIALGWLKRKFPFGPFLAMGAVLAAIWGEAIWSAYLKLFFPLI